ncbi:hypothetical protein GQ43DRAFT_425678 [Delitschia confertaspora ATCC 74209]|uniref:Mitochondrial division protein 1 n=1 Tax=Delitschia confertaspora ATCC 74209 TaxID=1513339 RepID=A0A9P4JI22_9PLEO|nr:hypothetical protein GQ43DRAFT_425678 [Delitschia confertaspora ATCC 74209]
MFHKGVIENNPLQTYMSALIFSPTHSLIRDLFKKEEPDWIKVKPNMEYKWTSCLHTLEGHSSIVKSVAFSHASTRLASASWDQTISDPNSGDCLQTLSTGTVLHISFDITGSYLHTEIGSIVLSDSVLTVLEPHYPKHRNLSISSDRVWIRHNSENLLWLPSGYRPSCSVVSEKTIGIGLHNGGVWIYEVQLSTS